MSNNYTQWQQVPKKCRAIIVQFMNFSHSTRARIETVKQLNDLDLMEIRSNKVPQITPDGVHLYNLRKHNGHKQPKQALPTFIDFLNEVDRTK